MSKRSQEKRRARSNEKKKSRRRMQSVSPMSRLAGTAEGTCECWMHYAKEDDRTRNVLVMRPVRGLGYVASFFLIDLDCVGLKDAFWRRDVDPMGLRETMRERSLEVGTTFVKVPLDDARRLIAGAMRWTMSHPFRLPSKTFEAIKILGDSLDVVNSPIGEFGTENRLYYLGYKRDLEKALKGISLDEFLDREDVECEFYDDASEEFGDFYEDDLDEDAEPTEEEQRVFNLANGMAERCVAEVKRHCAEKGIEPSSELETMAKIHVGSILAGIAAHHEGAMEEAAREEAMETLTELMEEQDPSHHAELLNALKQIFDCSATNPNDLVLAGMARLKDQASDIINVPFEETKNTEMPCSTRVTRNLPTC